MAMLAEPRRRKQRISANPRGTFFMEDEMNKGKQMLKKLGWKAGDGLGSKNQGMSEPIRPKAQSSSKGIGYDAKVDPWVVHNQSFDEILKKLNSSDAPETEETLASEEPDKKRQRLENMSKKSRARIHYKKFVKNKDLSSISTSDWDCIFGKSVSNVDTAASSPAGKNDGSRSESEKGESTEKSSEDGFNTVNKGSMQEYFEKKMAEKRKSLAKS